MSGARNSTLRSGIAALILLSPVVALLVVIAAEILIDVVLAVGVLAVCAIAAAVIGWVIFRRVSSDPELAHQSEPETEETAVATPPM
jgi:membrane protein implicated in regulation of membrane protease activity